MDDIIYILIGIAWIVYAAYRANKKQKKPQPARQEATPERPKPFRTILQEMMQEDSQEDYTPESESYDERAIEESQRQKTLYAQPTPILETIPSEEGISAFDYGKKGPFGFSYDSSEEEDTEKLYAEGFRFDIRKAIIYSAILNRPYN
jgi:hypothetical protein